MEGLGPLDVKGLGVSSQNYLFELLKLLYDHVNYILGVTWSCNIQHIHIN